MSSPDKFHQMLAEAAAIYDRAMAAPVATPEHDNRKKLTAREVVMIRKLKRDGHTQAAIAEIYAVNPATVSRICRGIYYK